MTRGEIEGLSGRALDAAVAELVMGHQVRRTSILGGVLLQLEDCLAVPAYSTTWQGLGLVVARLTEMVGDNGDHLRVELDVSSVQTIVIVYNTLGDVAVRAVEGPPETAAPTAVARVALLVVAHA